MSRQPKKRRRDKSPLTVEQILAWADEHYARTGDWPSVTTTGVIPGTVGTTWGSVNAALFHGRRGLPGGSSLARVLAEHRGCRRHWRNQPQLSEEEILAWIDDHFQRTGNWPNSDSGVVLAAPHETWQKIANALVGGWRGLRGGTSLSRFLLEHRGEAVRETRPILTEELILSWIDDHFQRTGSWPSCDSGVVLAAPRELWRNINSALASGCRGLPGGSSLVKLLAEHRGYRRHWRGQPQLTVEQILAWADDHHRRTGKWPTYRSGVVLAAPHETWQKIDGCLRGGCRGLPGGTSLPRLLAKHRGRPNPRGKSAPARARATRRRGPGTSERS